jgi:hypothetical protein
MLHKLSLAIAGILFACCNAYADAITFDNLPDLTVVTNQFPGVSFTGAQVLTSGSTLNSQFFRLLAIPRLFTIFRMAPSLQPLRRHQLEGSILSAHSLPETLQ